MQNYHVREEHDPKDVITITEPETAFEEYIEEQDEELEQFETQNSQITYYEESLDEEMKEPPPPPVRIKRVPSPKITGTGPIIVPHMPLTFSEVNLCTVISKNVKNARLQADGTAMINEANVPYLRERLEACIAKIFENVFIEQGRQPRGELYQIKMLFCQNPPKLKGIFECLMCGCKTINVCYKHKNGKFKQWINSNILRHVELSHKERFQWKKG